LIDRSDDEIVFDSTSMSAAGSEESGKEEIGMEGGVDKGSIFNDAQLNSATMQQTPTPQSVAIPSSKESEQYEFVASGGLDGDDGSMDELEAEILAALDD
jgi:membrane protease subunit (stomatin/prohibitin family)